MDKTRGQGRASSFYSIFQQGTWRFFTEMRHDNHIKIFKIGNQIHVENCESPDKTTVNCYFWLWVILHYYKVTSAVLMEPRPCFSMQAQRIQQRQITKCHVSCWLPANINLRWIEWMCKGAPKVKHISLRVWFGFFLIMDLIYFWCRDFVLSFSKGAVNLAHLI